MCMLTCKQPWEAGISFLSQSTDAETEALNALHTSSMFAQLRRYVITSLQKWPHSEPPLGWFSNSLLTNKSLAL